MYICKQSQLGFSLVELMVTIAIIGVMIGAAVPALSDSFGQSTATKVMRSLNKDLTLSRSQAINNQVVVTVCHLNTSNTCDGQWNKGYSAFIDSDSNGVYSSNDDTLLLVRDAFDSGTLGLTPSSNFVQFTMAGRILINGGAEMTGHFFYCPASGSTDARGVMVSGIGRTKLTEDFDADGRDETSYTNENSHIVCS